MSTKNVERKDVSRGWMITLPESEYPKEDVVAKLAPYTYVGQLECGESGTDYRHWQIYVENPTQVRFETLRNKFPKGHFEPRYGSKQSCYDYVTKVDTSLGESISNGEMNLKELKPGRAEELSRLKTLILAGEKTYADLLLEDSGHNHIRALQEVEYQFRRKTSKNKMRDVKVSYIYGKTGVGKTSHVYGQYADHLEQLHVVGDYRNPFDFYDNETCLVMDEFAGQIEVEYLLKLLDRFPIELRARYVNKFANFDRVFILSNLTLPECYPGLMSRSPEQWNALVRRIDDYQEMLADGSLVDRRSLVTR